MHSGRLTLGRHHCTILRITFVLFFSSSGVDPLLLDRVRVFSTLGLGWNHDVVFVCLIFDASLPSQPMIFFFFLTRPNVTIFKFLDLFADVNSVAFCSLELSLFRPSNRTDTATTLGKDSGSRQSRDVIACTKERRGTTVLSFSLDGPSFFPCSFMIAARILVSDMVCKVGSSSSNRRRISMTEPLRPVKRQSRWRDKILFGRISL